jgi:integrase/recombinase XerC
VTTVAHISGPLAESGAGVRPRSWTDAISAYVMMMAAAGRSSGTVRLHRHYLRRLQAHHPGGPWSVTVAVLEAFLSPAHWRPETRKSARTTVRAFYRWAHGRGFLADDPGSYLPTVKVPAGRPRPCPEHLVAQLVRDDTRTGRMAMLAAYAGLRAAEISRVRGTDLVVDNGMGELVVHGKGGKVRGVPILQPRLLAWLSGVGDAWAFPNGHGSHLSPGHVSRLLSRAMPDGWTAHTLRHRMGTRAYAGTRDLLAVGAILGHSRPETTQRYVLLPDDALRAAVAAAC